MRVTLTRTGENTYRVHVRTDAGTFELSPHTKTAHFPHEYTSLIVERELHLTRGNWASVAAGAVQSIEDPHPDRAAARLRGWRRQAGAGDQDAVILVATLSHIAQQALDRHWDRAARELRRMWRPPAGDRPMPTKAEVLRVCRALRAARARWAALTLGDSIELTWPGAHWTEAKEAAT